MVMGDGIHEPERERDRATLAKARMELEELYRGIPDDSVNLTFQDLAAVQVQLHFHPTMSNEETKPDKPPVAANVSPPLIMNKVPSLDFSRALRASKQHSHLHTMEEKEGYNSRGGRRNDHQIMTQQRHHEPDSNSSSSRSFDHPDSGGYVVDTMSSGTRHYHHGNKHSNMRMAPVTKTAREEEEMSIYSHYGPQHAERSGASAVVGGGVGLRRPGIPHSNICTLCTTYIYIFRHRCLVCGRVYCRQCVSMGMGEMTEGRKCIECLGRRFSIRYIHKAGTGKVGCFCFGYGSRVNQAELKWAEKGPRRTSRDRVGYGRSSASMMSATTITMGPKSPLKQPQAHPHSPFANSNPPSFVTGSPYSPASHRHYLPF